MGREEIGGGEEDFRAGSGLQIPSTWLVVAHVQHQELHRFLPCRKSMTSSPKYLVISVQLVHKFIWNYWSIYLHGIQLKQQAKLSLSTWTVLKRFFVSTWNSTFDVQAAGLSSTNSRYFLEKKCVPRKQTVKCLCTLCTRACRGFGQSFEGVLQAQTPGSLWGPACSYTFFCEATASPGVHGIFPPLPSFFFFFNWGAYLGTRVFLGARGTGFAATPSIKPIQPRFSTHHAHDFRHTDTKPEALTINPPSWITMQTIQTLYFKHFVCKEIITVL